MSIDSSLGRPSARFDRRSRRWLEWAMRFVRSAGVLGGLALSVISLIGCEKGIAGGLDPDFSGVWDVTYDDSIDVAVQLGGDHVVHDAIAEQGGTLSLHTANLSSELELDCTRPELVCPSEVWPHELKLRAAPGKLDGDGVQLVQSIVGRGQGRCAALPGSVVTGEVLTVTSASAVRVEAVALTSGRVRVVLDAACVAPTSTLPAGARVVLTAGYTAAKR